ncbi:MAG: phosphate starvation-inducible protein PhoH [Flavobacteriaceae bacterium]|nr:phosphate starvation-inducible protein PhoH [Flavobacteriaceae bacterium]
MNQLEIELTDIDPQNFFGTQNETLEILKSNFPKLKIIARGSKIKAYGEKVILEDFDHKLELLINYCENYNLLTSDAIIAILSSKDKIQPLEINNSLIIHGVNGKTITAKTNNQIKLIELINKNDIVFAIGPAGTGKTYTGVALAVKALKEKRVKQIILTRPAVEAGENLGFLPGDLKEKLDPYMQPLYDALNDMIPAKKLKYYIENKIIQIAPLAFMRGRTLDNAFVILDEAQNTTNAQMKMFLTRMGPNAKFMITGDPAQIDFPKKVSSGLKQASLVLKNIPGVGIVYLDKNDVIRHNIVKKIVEAYNRIDNKQ